MHARPVLLVSCSPFQAQPVLLMFFKLMHCFALLCSEGVVRLVLAEHAGPFT